jgi:vancomycin permeability regulator SanA
LKIERIGFNSNCLKQQIFPDQEVMVIVQGYARSRRIYQGRYLGICEGLPVVNDPTTGKSVKLQNKMVFLKSTTLYDLSGVQF